MVCKILPHLDKNNIIQLNESKFAIDKINKKEYDLILLDLKMPIVSGFDILQKLNDINYFKNHHTRIIIITALLQHDINNIIQKYDNIDILYKPIKLNQLKNKILQRI